MDVILNNQPLSTLWSKAHQALERTLQPKKQNTHTINFLLQPIFEQ